MELNGKVALITGASSGIGASTAKKLAEQGVRVGLAARRLDRLQALVSEIESAGGEAMALAMDVTDPASVNKGVEALHKRYGHIDIAFNNAGLMPISDIASLRVDEWHRMVDVNVKACLTRSRPYCRLCSHSARVISSIPRRSPGVKRFPDWAYTARRSTRLPPSRIFCVWSWPSVQHSRHLASAGCR